MSRPPPDSPADLSISSNDAFELIGNETRLAILRALWTAPSEPMSFSELRKQAGNPDSGQFNYHLNKLLGSFIQKTDDGYRPLRTGKQLVTTILAGNIDDPPEFDRIPIDGSCPFCDGALAASYRNEEATVQCQACGKIQMLEEFPPVAVATRTTKDAIHALDRWVMSRTQLMTEGVCPNCAGTVATTVFETRSTAPDDHDFVRVRHQCTTCQYESDVPIWLYVLLVNHPAVITFYYDHGIDLTALPAWERTRHGQAFDVDVQSQDPLVVTVTIALQDETLSLTLDDDLSVRETRRESRSLSSP